jgi:hypothetical protein
MIGTILAIGITLLPSSPAIAREHKTGQKFAAVDGERYRVSLFDDGSVRVIRRAAVGGGGITPQRRERMRQAVAQATGCTIADDYLSDGTLLGKLVCGDAAK